MNQVLILFSVSVGFRFCVVSVNACKCFWVRVCECMFVGVCVCVRAHVRACDKEKERVRECVSACVRANVRVICISVHSYTTVHLKFKKKMCLVYFSDV